MEEYNINPKFKEYVDKYCEKHKITPQQAVEHELVKEVEAEYRHKRQNVTFRDISNTFIYA